MDISKHCDGCMSLVHNDILDICGFCNYNQNGECPCTLCVVKVMCDTSCDVFDVFKSTYKE